MNALQITSSTSHSGWNDRTKHRKGEEGDVTSKHGWPRHTEEEGAENHNDAEDRQKSQPGQWALEGVTAYHDLRHAVGPLVELISDSLPSKSRPLRSGLSTYVLHDFLLHEFTPLGKLFGTRALARLVAQPACARHCRRSSARPLGRCRSANVRPVRQFSLN